MNANKVQQTAKRSVRHRIQNNLKMVIYPGANQALVIRVRYTWFTMEALEDTWENLQKIIEVCKLTSSDL